MLEILPKSFYYKWELAIENSKLDPIRACRYLAELDSEEISKAMSMGNEIIVVVKKNLGTLKNSRSDVEKNLALYKSKLKSNPLINSSINTPNFKDTDQFIDIMNSYIKSVQIETFQMKEIATNYKNAKLRGDCK